MSRPVINPDALERVRDRELQAKRKHVQLRYEQAERDFQQHKSSDQFQYYEDRFIKVMLDRELVATNPDLYHISDHYDPVNELASQMMGVMRFTPVDDDTKERQQQMNDNLSFLETFRSYRESKSISDMLLEYHRFIDQQITQGNLPVVQCFDLKYMDRKSLSTNKPIRDAITFLVPAAKVRFSWAWVRQTPSQRDELMSTLAGLSDTTSIDVADDAEWCVAIAPVLISNIDNISADTLQVYLLASAIAMDTKRERNQYKSLRVVHQQTTTKPEFTFAYGVDEIKTTLRIENIRENFERLMVWLVQLIRKTMHYNSVIFTSTGWIDRHVVKLDLVDYMEQVRKCRAFLVKLAQSMPKDQRIVTIEGVFTMLDSITRVEYLVSKRIGNPKPFRYDYDDTMKHVIQALYYNAGSPLSSSLKIHIVNQIMSKSEKMYIDWYQAGWNQELGSLDIDFISAKIIPWLCEGDWIAQVEAESWETLGRVALLSIGSAMMHGSNESTQMRSIILQFWKRYFEINPNNAIHIIGHKLTMQTFSNEIHRAYLTSHLEYIVNEDPDQVLITRCIQIIKEAIATYKQFRQLIHENEYEIPESEETGFAAYWDQFTFIRQLMQSYRIQSIGYRCWLWFYPHINPNEWLELVFIWNRSMRYGDDEIREADVLWCMSEAQKFEYVQKSMKGFTVSEPNAMKSIPNRTLFKQTRKSDPIPPAENDDEDTVIIPNHPGTIYNVFPTLLRSFNYLLGPDLVTQIMIDTYRPQYKPIQDDFEISVYRSVHTLFKDFPFEAIKRKHTSKFTKKRDKRDSDDEKQTNKSQKTETETETETDNDMTDIFFPICMTQEEFDPMNEMKYDD